MPLTRSDYLIEGVEPISQQGQTYSVADWLLYFGTGVKSLDAYDFPSRMTPALVAAWDLRGEDLGDQPFSTCRPFLSPLPALASAPHLVPASDKAMWRFSAKRRILA